MTVGLVLLVLGVVGLVSGVILRSRRRTRRRRDGRVVSRTEFVAGILVEVISAVLVFAGAAVFWLSLP